MKNADLRNNFVNSKGYSVGQGYARRYDSQNQLEPLDLSQNGSFDNSSQNNKYSSYKGAMKIKTGLLKPIPISNQITVTNPGNKFLQK